MRDIIKARAESVRPTCKITPLQYCLLRCSIKSNYAETVEMVTRAAEVVNRYYMYQWARSEVQLLRTSCDKESYADCVSLAEGML